MQASVIDEDQAILKYGRSNQQLYEVDAMV